jgi:GT2 family glycosyltransferase
MIRALRRFLHRKRRLRTPVAGRLSDFLVLVVTRRRPLRGATPIGTRKIGRFHVSVHELPGEGDRLPAPLPLGELVDELDVRLDHDGREALGDFVFTTVLPHLEGPGAFSLGKSLHDLRQRLRGPLPVLPTDFTTSQNVVFDSISRIDDRSFWVLGWIRDDDGTMTSLQAVSPEGQRVELLTGSYRCMRKDVEESLTSVGIQPTGKHGFVRYVEFPAPSLLNEGWLGEIGDANGPKFEIPGPQVSRDPLELRRMLVGDLAVDKANAAELRRDHAYPALRRLQTQIAASIEVESAAQLGEPPASPEVSIVVPLYRRIDLLEHQLAHFWQDPDLQAAELLYVLDSPELRETVTELAGKLHELYGLPFQVLCTSENAGFAVANNRAASLARGRLLLLLNSDVIPSGQGWLARMRDFYDATPSIGTLGPKLLYEDGSIQHAGMYFQRDPGTRLWENQHYFKGFSATLPAANVTRPVPAVTGACMMVERALFEQLGGLSEQYVQGGYEDSDFCLRLGETGRRNWYIADVDLYHLEAQSFFIHARHANRCNAWMQTHQWDQRIQDLMSESQAQAETRLTTVG